MLEQRYYIILFDKVLNKISLKNIIFNSNRYISITYLYFSFSSMTFRVLILLSNGNQGFSLIKIDYNRVNFVYKGDVFARTRSV